MCLFSMNDEVWHEVPEHHGIRASSWGRILLPEGQAKTHNGGLRTYKTKPSYGCWAKGSGGGRYIYHWRKMGTLKIAKLVCLAFHGPMPFPKAVVMHLDENSRNNRSDNLSWGTQKQNLNAPGFLTYCRGRIGDKNPVIKGRRKTILL